MIHPRKQPQRKHRCGLRFSKIVALVRQPFLGSSLLLLLALHSGAQSIAAPANDQTMSTVEVTPPSRRVVLRSEETDEVCGQYALSNGWRLKVDPSSIGIDARIDRQRPIHLVAVRVENMSRATATWSCNSIPSPTMAR